MPLSIAPRARPPLGPAPFQARLRVCRLLWALVCSARASTSIPADRRRFQLRSRSVRADSARAADSGAARRTPRLLCSRCSVRSAGGWLVTIPLLQWALEILTRSHSASRTALWSPSRLPPILRERRVRRMPPSSATAASTFAPAAGPIWLLVRSSSVRRELLWSAAASSLPPCTEASVAVVSVAVVNRAEVSVAVLSAC